MKKIFKNQVYHLMVYILLGSILFLYVRPEDTSKTFLNLSSSGWLMVSWISIGVFHLFVLLTWRSELYFKGVSKIFGKAAFTVHRIGFVTFGGIGVFPILPFSYLNRNTLHMAPEFRLFLFIVTAIPALWTLYSVIFYFTVNRAFGADHFFKEYRSKTLETRGPFKYIPNSMYTLALLAFYHPGLLFDSYQGLILALFHHIFVWTHYFCTEKPDLKEIYGK